MKNKEDRSILTKRIDKVVKLRIVMTKEILNKIINNKKLKMSLKNKDKDNVENREKKNREHIKKIKEIRLISIKNRIKSQMLDLR